MKIKRRTSRVAASLRGAAGRAGCVLVLASLLAACSTTPKKPVETAPPKSDAAANDATSGDPGASDAAVDTSVPDRPPEDPAFSVKVSDEAQEEIGEAIAAMDSGDYGAAEDTLRDWTSDEQAGFLAHYNLGVLADRRSKVEEAKAAYEAALAANPDFAPALVNLVRMHLRQGQSDRALSVADRYIRAKPDNLNHIDARVQVLIHIGRYEDAIRESKEVLRGDETNVRAMFNLARAYYSLGRVELASDILAQISKDHSGNTALMAEVEHLRGFVLLAQERDGKAILALEKAIQLRPNYAEGRNNLGVLYHKARDYQNAIEHFTAAIALFPEFKEAHLNLGNAYKGQKNWVEAERAFLKASSLDTNYASAYFNLGILYLDAQFEGRDKKDLFQLAIDNFNRYKAEMKSALPRDDPADKYIAEAKKRIEVEKQREEMMRQAEQEMPEDDLDDPSLDDGLEDPSLEDDGLEDPSLEDGGGGDDAPPEDDVPLEDDVK